MKTPESNTPVECDVKFSIGDVIETKIGEDDNAYWVKCLITNVKEDTCTVMFTQDSAYGKFMQQSGPIPMKKIRHLKGWHASTDSGEEASSDFLDSRDNLSGGGRILSPIHCDDSDETTATHINLPHSFIKPSNNNYLQAADSEDKRFLFPPVIDGEFDNESFFHVLDDMKSLQEENEVLKEQAAENEEVYKNKYQKLMKKYKAMVERNGRLTTENNHLVKHCQELLRELAEEVQEAEDYRKKTSSFFEDGENGKHERRSGGKIDAMEHASCQQCIIS